MAPPNTPSKPPKAPKKQSIKPASKAPTSASIGAATKVPGKLPPVSAYVSSPATVSKKQASQRVLRTILLNRMQSYDFAGRVGNERVIALMKACQRDLEKRLRKVNPALVAEGAFTPTAMRATLLQIQDVVKQLTLPGMRSSVTDTKRIGQALGMDDGLKNLVAMDKRFAGIVSTVRASVAMQLDTKAKGVNASVLRRLASKYPNTKPGKGILERYGTNVIEKFENRLQVAVVTGKPWNEVRDDLIDDSTWLQDSPMFWAQRIVRSEQMGAYNASVLDSGREIQQALETEDMVKILVAGFDDRTGWDSYQVHGQIRRLEEPFEWTTKDGQTIAYMHPPNRPNDREAIVFHRLEWAIPPELEPVSDAEYEAVFSEQNKKGGAPERPVMSTVPLELFGKASAKS